MVTERRTRATSVAATKAAEPPSRRTRAASVSANKRPEREIKKAVATPKRKRSVSAAPRSVSRSAAAEASTPVRRDSGRQKKRKIDDDHVEEPRGRKLEREVEEEVLPDLTQHNEKKMSFVESALGAIGEGRLKKERKAELQKIHQELALAEKELTGKKDIGGMLTDIGWRLEAEKTVEERAVEERVKMTPVSRVKGAYFDTTAQGILKAPLSARVHRTQLKHLFDEKEKAAKMLEDLKAEFADGLEFYEKGGTNIAMIDGYHEMRYKLATLEEQHKEVQTERGDIEKVKAFSARVEGLKDSFIGMEKANRAVVVEEARKKLEKGREVALIDEYSEEDGTIVEKEADLQLQDNSELIAVWDDDGLEKVADAPSTAKKPTEEKPKKTPRRKSIRMGALSIFTPTPGGTRANSEDAEVPAPSSPLSPPPAVRDSAPEQVSANPSLRAPNSISWATPVSEIHDFLTASSSAVAKSHENITFDPRPIGFKCPGHKREWRGAEQTKELIIYRDWLNHPPNKNGQLFGFFMTPRDVGKAPSASDLKSLKDWKAWGACFSPSVTAKAQDRKLYIFDPELSETEATKMQKTGELTKMQQLLVGAVKRCRGGCEAVVIDSRREPEMEGKDSFALTAEWAAKSIREGGLTGRANQGKSLVIAK